MRYTMAQLQALSPKRAPYPKRFVWARQDRIQSIRDFFIFICYIQILHLYRFVCVIYKQSTAAFLHHLLQHHIVQSKFDHWWIGRFWYIAEECWSPQIFSQVPLWAHYYCLRCYAAKVLLSSGHVTVGCHNDINLTRDTVATSDIAFSVDEAFGKVFFIFIHCRDPRPCSLTS